jgi:hypothetical protein
MSTRRGLLRVVSLGMVAPVLVSAATAASAAHAAALPRPASLAAQLEQAISQRKALVLLVSLDGCPYCKLVRESYLVPMRSDGQPVVQIELAAPIPLIDLRGRESTHANVVRGFDVRVAPTVLFLGRGGVEAAPRLVGVASSDFYGAYLQERIEAANRRTGI